MTDLSALTHKFLVYKDYLLNLNTQIEGFKNKTSDLKNLLSDMELDISVIQDPDTKSKAELVYKNERVQLDEADKVLASLIKKYDEVRDLSSRTTGFVNELQSGKTPVGLSSSIPFIPIMGVVAGAGAIVGFVNYLENYFSPAGRIAREQSELIKRVINNEITPEQYKTLSDDIYKVAIAVESNLLRKYTGIDLPRSLLLGALVVGGYFVLTKTDIPKKILGKILR